MARIWKEQLDPTRHRDFVYPQRRGGIRISAHKDRLVVQWVYFVNVCSFTFQFHRVEDIRAYLTYFSQKPIPSSGKTGGAALEPYWRNWHERFPMWLKEEPKRKKVVKALQRALDEFENEMER